MKRAMAFALMVTAGAAGAAGAPPAFTQRPVAVTTDGKTTITFAVDRPTDVAVYIEDRDGRIIRHLAAGVLGDNAPAPLAKGALAQSLVWDGADDEGRPAAGGPFRVRVGLGLTAEYAGTAFADPVGANILTGVTGLAVGPDGRLYVISLRWSKGWWKGVTFHTFRRDGKYERTIKPFSASLAPERVKAVTALTTADSRPLPTIYRLNAMTFYPNEDFGQQPAVTPDGHMHFVVLPPAYRKWPAKQVATIDAEGGIPYAAYAGPDLGGETSPGAVYLAPSSDGTAVYVTGILRGPGDTDRPNVHAVFRVRLPERDKAEVFFGDPATAGDDAKHLSNPQGLATDGQGRLFVADRGNNRIVVVNEKDGTVLRTAYPAEPGEQRNPSAGVGTAPVGEPLREAAGTMAVPVPGWVAVHKKTGAVYVHSGDRVVKFSGWKTPKEEAVLNLPQLTERERQSTRWCFALDPEAEPAVLWVGRNAGDDCLLRCEDQGTTFTDLTRAGYQPGRTYWNVAAGLDRQTISCKVGNTTLRLLGEATGKWRDVNPTGSAGQTYRLGPDDQIYGMDHWRWGVRRWDRDGKPLPFPASLQDPEFKGRLFNVPSGTTSWERDFCVDHAGNVYTKQRGKVYHGRMRVDEYDKDGNFKRTVLWVVSDGALGPRVDRQGNVYIAESITPVGVPYPEMFQDKLPKVQVDTKGDVAYQYRWMYGSIIKFSPRGGAVWFPIRDERDTYPFDGRATIDPALRKEPFNFASGDRMLIGTGELQGALWWRFGCSFVLDMHPGHNRRCHCTATEFDVDDFGRVFYPDQGRFLTVVLDTNGNEITTIGGYGNQDDAADRIASTWIVGLAVSDRYLYLADAFNRRVQRARVTYAAQATCEVK